MKRAVHRVLGNKVTIEGGSLLDLMLSAKGAAIAGCKRLESWMDMRGKEQNHFEHQEL